MCIHRELLWLTREWKPVLDKKHGLNRARHWRKGDHWRALIRKHAQLAVEDQQLVKAFSEDCKRCHVRIYSGKNGLRFDLAALLWNSPDVLRT